jgi:hypothetical protein
MVVAAALVSFGLSLLVGWVLSRRARRGVGPSWEEWRDAEHIGGRWSRLVGAGAFVATLVGICGFGTSGPLRALLLGGVLGFCAPFAVEGARRYLRARREPAGQGG